MSKQTGLTKEQLEDMYLVKHLTYQEIGDAFKVTRQCIYKAVKRFGIDTANGERFMVKCDYCDKEYSLTRGRYNAQRAHYCSEECYYGHKASILPKRAYNRQAKRIARAVMEHHLRRPLVKDETIHHIDGDEFNNSVENLMLFCNQSEHLRYHHQLRFATLDKGGEA